MILDLTNSKNLPAPVAGLAVSYLGAGLVSVRGFPVGTNINLLWTIALSVSISRFLAASPVIPPQLKQQLSGKIMLPWSDSLAGHRL